MPSIEGEIKKLDRKEELDRDIKTLEEKIKNKRTWGWTKGYGDERDVPGLTNLEAELRQLEQEKAALGGE